MQIDLESVDHVLTTTRAVRKRLDLERPVERSVLERCIEIAIQAPTGLIGETWHFVVATEPEKRLAVAKVYRKAVAPYNAGGAVPDRYLASVIERPVDDTQSKRLGRMFDASLYFTEHLHEVPVLIVPCIEGDAVDAGSTQASLYGSILPATWSLCLALRARGIGSCWTTVHISHQEEMAEVLGLPRSVTQVALLAVAYLEGTELKPARRRRGAVDCIHWNSWREPRRQ